MTSSYKGFGKFGGSKLGVIVMFPTKGISNVQRQQMVSCTAHNVKVAMLPLVMLMLPLVMLSYSLVMLSYSLAPLCKCLALIHGFRQCKIRTYQPSNWPANKVML